jgi:hypothetical protein
VDFVIFRLYAIVIAKAGVLSGAKKIFGEGFTMDALEESAEHFVGRQVLGQ